MKNIIKKSMSILLALSLLIVGAAAAQLTADYFRGLDVAHGTFAVGVRPSADGILGISGWNNSDALEFPYVDVGTTYLGELGQWVSGETMVPRTAQYTVSLEDPELDSVELAFRIWIEGSDAESAAAALAVGIEVNDAAARAFILSADLISEGDGPFYPQEDGTWATPDIFLGVVSQDTTATIGIALMSTATEVIRGDYKITVDIYPLP